MIKRNSINSNLLTNKNIFEAIAIIDRLNDWLMDKHKSNKPDERIIDETQFHLRFYGYIYLICIGDDVYFSSEIDNFENNQSIFDIVVDRFTNHVRELNKLIQ